MWLQMWRHSRGRCETDRSFMKRAKCVMFPPAFVLVVEADYRLREALLSMLEDDGWPAVGVREMHEAQCHLAGSPSLRRAAGSRIAACVAGDASLLDLCDRCSMGEDSHCGLFCRRDSCPRGCCCSSVLPSQTDFIEVTTSRATPVSRAFVRWRAQLLPTCRRVPAIDSWVTGHCRCARTSLCSFRKGPHG
jgi:hypothetical protein